MPVVVWSVGHSNGEAESMVGPLREAGVEVLVDVRRFPKSRRILWADVDQLPGVLAKAGIEYVHVPELGGRRRARPDTPNLGWRNVSFRGYADHMATPEFARGLERLLALASSHRVAMMCSEAVPWRCHRNLVADALVARGIEVRHLVGGREQPHRLTPFAHVVDGLVTYPPEGGVQQRLDVGAPGAADPRTGRKS